MKETTGPLVARMLTGLARALRVVLAALRAVAVRAGPLVADLGRRLADRWRFADRTARRRLLMAVVAIPALLWAAGWRHTVGHWWDAVIAGNRPLNQVSSWYYFLSDVDLERLARSEADLLVIDYAVGGGLVPLTPEQVGRLKKKPNGAPRLVIAYLSIGEAEGYRFYWRKDWAGDDMPGWHVAENCAWPDNHMVRYWHDGWRDIIYRGRRSYLKRIIDAGFDGVYLDRIDVWGELEAERPTAREDMIGFVRELAQAGRKLKPGFLVVAQNAEDLLEERHYRDAIDGLGKEDLLHGHVATGQRNSERAIRDSISHIRKLQWDFKPVLAVEYLSNKEAIAATAKELKSLSMVPTFAHRNLDGLDPTEPATKPRFAYGTPEWIATHCKNKPHW